LWIRKTVRKFGQLKRDLVAMWMGLDLKTIGLEDLDLYWWCVITK